MQNKLSVDPVTGISLILDLVSDARSELVLFLRVPVLKGREGCEGEY